MKEKIQALQPSLRKNSFFLSNDFAPALIGTAHRSDLERPYALYDWRAHLLNLDTTQDPAEAFRRAHKLLEAAEGVGVAVLMQNCREAFWRKVAAGELVAWDQMHDTILGEVYFGPKAFTVSVGYSFDKLIDKLVSGTDYSDLSPDDMTTRYERARTYFDTQMFNTPFVKGTPPAYIYTNYDPELS